MDWTTGPLDYGLSFFGLFLDHFFKFFFNLIFGPFFGGHFMGGGRPLVLQYRL